MGFIRPTKGTARVFGLDCWKDATKVKARVGFLPGDLRMYEDMTGREFLDFFAAFRRNEAPGRRRELVERLEVDLKPRIKQLSKGNRQKLAIVEALMHGAPLLLLDEPSSGLDPIMQMRFIDFLREEQARGTTVFLSSHMLHEVELIAHRVAIMREGRLMAVEEVERLKALREREMEVTLHEPATADRFTGLEGVRVLAVENEGRHIRLAIRGQLGPLLSRLGEMRVDDLVFSPANLESVFLHYYGAEEPATAPASEAAV
jgi:ABC-2 type transport system ATP-binding protein